MSSRSESKKAAREARLKAEQEEAAKQRRQRTWALIGGSVLLAAVVVVVLLFLTGPLAYMPNAVLASVVFLIGIRLIAVNGMREIYRLRKGEFAVAAITAAVVVVVGVEQGIILAMALSIIEHVYHSYKPYDTLVVESSEHGRTTATLDSGAQIVPGVAVYLFGSGLYYANSTRFTEEIMGVVEHADPPLRALVLLGSAMADVDYSGADSLRQVQEELARKGVTLALADMNPKLRGQLDAYGPTATIGAGNIHGSLRDAVRALGDAPPAAAAAPAADAPEPAS